MKDILLLEDNLELASLISIFLEKESYTVHHVASGEEALAYFSGNTVKLIILDIMLPGIDGFAVCKSIRKQGNVPILMISAKSDKDDKLNGFQLGADDFIEKPVDPDILTAKARALIYRAYNQDVKSDLLVSGAITIDRNSRSVFLNQEKLELNVKEYDLLLLLAENSGKTLHKEYLFNQIWGQNSFSENQTLTVHIKMLRKKIEEDAKQPRRIQTVWGVGYRYEEV